MFSTTCTWDFCVCVFFWGLWKSIEESNIRMYVLQLHVIWTIWNHSLVEVPRLMPYIIHQVWRCQICHLSNLRVLEIWYTRLRRCFPPHAHGTNLSMYGIQLHVIWINYLEPLFGGHVEVDAQYLSPSLEMSNVWYLPPVMCGYPLGKCLAMWKGNCIPSTQGGVCVQSLCLGKDRIL